jgi:hypothetical protein
VDQVVAFGAEKILGKLVRGKYDLIVLAGQPSDPAVIDAVLRSVETGTGLVAVEPLASGGATHPEELDRLRTLLPTEVLAGSRFRAVCGALAPDVLEQTSHGQPVLKALAVGEPGQSRLARLTWSESVPGLIPFIPGTGEWWEYRWAALARACLWAARREPVPRIESLANSDPLTIRVGAADRAPLELAVEWDTPFGILPGERVRVAEPKDGGASVSVAIDPRLRRRHGPHVGRVLLLKDGGPVDFAACVVPGAEPRLRIDSVEAPLTVQPNESWAVHVICDLRFAICDLTPFAICDLRFAIDRTPDSGLRTPDNRQSAIGNRQSEQSAIGNRKSAIQCQVRRHNRRGLANRTRRRLRPDHRPRGNSGRPG